MGFVAIGHRATFDAWRLEPFWKLELGDWSFRLIKAPKNFHAFISA